MPATPSPPNACQHAKRTLRQPGRLAVLVIVLNLATAAFAAADDDPRQTRPNVPTAVQRAIVFLSREITTWNQGHDCYSCHHSGDALRALLIARQRGYSVDAAEVSTSTRWLHQPGEWSHNGPEGEFNDYRLATLQFAGALAATKQDPATRIALNSAADLVARELNPDGRWPAQQIGTIGSPITYGPFLATRQAREILRQAASPKFAEPIEKATSWLRTSQPKSVLNSAATLWGLAADKHPDSVAVRKQCLKLIRRGQSRDGGWGPYVNSAPEPFDTSVVVLALQASGTGESDELITRGRDFLLGLQLPDGSWPETTRPADRESYAHRISTTAWCLQALVTLPPR